MCTVLLPPGVYPIAVKYVLSYHNCSYQGLGYRYGSAASKVQIPTTHTHKQPQPIMQRKHGLHKAC